MTASNEYFLFSNEVRKGGNPHNYFSNTSQGIVRNFDSSSKFQYLFELIMQLLFHYLDVQLFFSELDELSVTGYKITKVAQTIAMTLFWIIL